MAGRLKRELIKTKYVNLTILPLHPPRAVVESGSCLPCWKALRGNQKRMTEWKRPFKQWAQKTCKIEGRRMEEEGKQEGGVGGGRFQEGRAKQSGGTWKKEKAFKKKKKGVLGAPVFQVTPDLDLLWQPSARLSGGFVRASLLNGHPADRHVVYSLCVMGKREAAKCVYEQWKARRPCVAFIYLIFYLLSAIGKKKKIPVMLMKEKCGLCGFPFKLYFIMFWPLSCESYNWWRNKWQEV